MGFPFSFYSFLLCENKARRSYGHLAATVRVEGVAIRLDRQGSGITVRAGGVVVVQDGRIVDS